jgi:hypothetical protein
LASDPSQKILLAYMAEPSGELLDTLIVDVATPVVKRVVRRRFYSARDTTLEDQEDVCGDSLAAIINRVKRLSTAADPRPIEDFESYAAGVALHTATRFFMARSPQRTLLRNRLRYVLTTDSRFEVWRSDHGAWMCALSGKSTTLSDMQIEACRLKLSSTSLPTGRLPDLVHKILTISPGAIELSAFTSLAAGCLGITDRTEPVEGHAGTMLSSAAGAERSVEMRDSLRRLWAEVCELPVSQRIALLLNLGSLWLIPDLAIASFRELAAKLDMTPEDLAALWNRIPLPDKEIAVRLNLERQQVINLRSSARQRLTRRMPI